jgi:hypothetical protein
MRKNRIFREKVLPISIAVTGAFWFGDVYSPWKPVNAGIEMWQGYLKNEEVLEKVEEAREIGLAVSEDKFKNSRLREENYLLSGISP